jgi:AraC-like DNA-binding protein
MDPALYQPFPMASIARGQVWRYSPEYRRPRHFHAEPEINIVSAGSATFGVGESTMNVRAGDLLWWLPGQDHELIEASLDFDLFVVGFTPALSARVLGSMTAEAHCGAVLTHLAADATKRLVARCAGLLTVADIPAIEQRAGDLWHEAHALRRAGRGLEDMHALTRRALRSLLERGDVRRSDVSLAGADPGDVSRHFRRNVKLTLTAYRRRLRLLRFIEEMDRRPRSLLAAAHAAGFGSYSQCHRSFQSILGCTPRAFFAGPTRDAMSATFEPPASWSPAPAARGSLRSATASDRA